jgi:hypothetical protein
MCAVGVGSTSARSRPNPSRASFGKAAEAAGAEFVLLSYPPNFYPESEQDIFDYTKAFCDSTNLAVMLFPMFLWGFYARIHPSDIPVRLIRLLLDACPNLAAIKAEGGFPGIQSFVECQRLFGGEVVISMPIEGELIPLAQLVPIQLSATSDHEYYGPMIPKVFNLLCERDFDKASEMYWKLHPARKAKNLVSQQMHGGFFLNRMMWKFQGWLQSYNGGPLRMPTQRIHDPQMHALRKGLIDLGLEPSMDPFREVLHRTQSSLSAARCAIRDALASRPAHASAPGGNMAESYDIVVMGGGQNTLGAAAYHAKAGKKIVVLERHRFIGGGAVTLERDAPGFKYDKHSMVHIFIQANPLNTNASWGCCQSSACNITIRRWAQRLCLRTSARSGSISTSTRRVRQSRNISGRTRRLIASSPTGASASSR